MISVHNVPGLLNHDSGRTFAAILATLSDLGYCVEWSVLNSKHFGVPQSRKRVFLICYLDPRCAGKILPVPGGHGKALVQLLGGSQGYKQAGNSVTVNVIEAIGRRLRAVDEALHREDAA